MSLVLSWPGGGARCRLLRRSLRPRSRTRRGRLLLLTTRPPSANGGVIRALRNANWPPLSVPIQSWLLYQMRFLLAAEMMGALSSFGGLPASLAHLANVLNLATVDSVAVSMLYDRLAKQHLEERLAPALRLRSGVSTFPPSWALRTPFFAAGRR